jgi:uncharacterized protein YbjT (DUF2867 family)
MATTTAPTVFVVGGTGAQGIPVIQGLVHDKAFRVRALSRDLDSARSKTLKALGDVELVKGTFASEDNLHQGFRGCQYAFVNIDGFNSGEKTEMYWAIRAYEIALEEGIKFFVYGNLDYAYKKSGYDPRCRAGHYDGKGRVGEWILQQTKTNGHRMGAALFTTGPYIEMAISAGTIMTPVIEEDVVVWKVPLSDGAVAHVALDDCAHYVRWLFDHQDESNRMDLEVAIDHVTYNDIAAAFTKVTGKAAKCIDLSLEDYWKHGPVAGVPRAMPAGYNATVGDPATMSFQDNFSGFWNIWRMSGGNRGVIQRDYALLDRIHPKRIRSVEQWFRLEDEKGRKAGCGGLWEQVQNLQLILKISEDGRKGLL